MMERALTGAEAGFTEGSYTVQDIVTEIELSGRGSQSFPVENNLLYVSLYLQSVQRIHLVSKTCSSTGNEMSEQSYVFRL